MFAMEDSRAQIIKKIQTNAEKANFVHYMLNTLQRNLPNCVCMFFFYILNKYNNAIDPFMY